MTGIKYVRRAGSWCVWQSLKDKDGKQKMDIKWFDTKEKAQEEYDKLNKG